MGLIFQVPFSLWFLYMFRSLGTLLFGSYPRKLWLDLPCSALHRPPPQHLCLLQDQVLGGCREKRAMGFASFFWECSSSDQRRKFPSLSVSGIVGPLLSLPETCLLPLASELEGFSQSFLSAWKPTCGSSLPTSLQKPKHSQGLLFSR